MANNQLNRGLTMNKKFGKLMRTLCRNDQYVVDQVLAVLKQSMLVEKETGIEVVNESGVLNCILELEGFDSNGNPYPETHKRNLKANVIPLKRDVVSVQHLKQVPLYYPEDHEAEGISGAGPWRIIMWVEGSTAHTFLQSHQARRNKKFEQPGDVYIEFTGSDEAIAAPVHQLSHAVR